MYPDYNVPIKIPHMRWTAFLSVDRDINVLPLQIWKLGWCWSSPTARFIHFTAFKSHKYMSRNDVVAVLILFVFPNCYMHSAGIIIEKKCPESCQGASTAQIFFKDSWQYFLWKHLFIPYGRLKGLSPLHVSTSQPQSPSLTKSPFPACCSNFYYIFLFSQKPF